MLFFCFEFTHYCFQLIKPFIPHFAEWVDKVSYVFHLFGIEVIVYFPTGLPLFEQSALGQDLDVFGDRLAGGVEVIGDRAGRHGVQGDQNQDGSPGWIGNGLKYVSAGFHFMQLFDCKIMQLLDCAKFF